MVDLADCNEIADELRAMKEADEFINKRSKDNRDPLFLAKAIVLLCIDKDKDRHGRNFSIAEISMNSFADVKLLDNQIPDWVFDCHTIRGKAKGRTDLDMTIDEEKALTPKRKNFFDDCSWYNAYYDDYKKGLMNEEEWQKFLKFAEGRKDK